MNSKDILNNIIDSFKPLKRYKDYNNNNQVPIELLIVDAKGRILSLPVSELNFTPANQNNLVKTISGSYTYNPSELVPIDTIVNNLPSFSISSTEIGIISLQSVVNNKTVLEKYLLKTGKGTYGTGGTTLTINDLELVYKNILSSSDLISDTTTTYIISALAGVTLSQYINTGTETYIVKPLNEGQTLFIVGEDADTRFYLFIGTPGSYGYNANNVTPADFQLLPNGGYAPSLDAVTQVGNTSLVPIIIESALSHAFTMLTNIGIRYYNNGRSLFVGSQELTDNREIVYPDKSGVVALTSDVTNLDPKYTISIPVILPESDSAGAYKNGDTFVLTNENFVSAMTKILQKVINPILIAPSFTITIPNSSILHEVGSNFTGTLTGIFNRGEIKGKLVGGVWQPNTAQNFRAGNANSYTLDGTIQPTNTNVINKVLSLGINNITGSVSYDAGAQPTNSVGADYSGPLPAGTINASSIAVKAVYPVFYGTIASGETIDDIDLSTFTKITNINADNTVSIPYNSIVGRKLVILIPTENTIKTKWYVNAINNGTIGNFGDLFAAPVEETYDSPTSLWAAKDYNVYISTSTSIDTIIELRN